jgi:hypothetical protein
MPSTPRSDEGPLERKTFDLSYLAWDIEINADYYFLVLSQVMLDVEPYLDWEEAGCECSKNKFKHLKEEHFKCSIPRKTIIKYTLIVLVIY